MLLEIKNLSKSFDGVEALRNCSFIVKEKSITALIGPNGAGKTTVFNIISGLVKQDSGNITLKNISLKNLNIHQRANQGISRTFQLVRLFPKLSVMENLLLAFPKINEGFFASLIKRKPIKKQEKTARLRCHAVLENIGLKEKAYELAADLSYGQQKLVELARCFIGESDILLLDEPVAGVNPVLREKIKTILKQIQKNGKTILLIEHDMKFVLDIADEIIVLNYGEEIAFGSPHDIKNNPKVLEAYLGERIKP